MSVFSDLHGAALLPILHARPQALVTGGRHVLDGQLTQAACHHGHRPELALGGGAVGILPIEPVLRAAAHGPVVRAHERHLHAGEVWRAPRTLLWLAGGRAVK